MRGLHFRAYYCPYSSGIFFLSCALALLCIILVKYFFSLTSSIISVEFTISLSLAFSLICISLAHTIFFLLSVSISFIFLCAPWPFLARLIFLSLVQLCITGISVTFCFPCTHVLFILAWLLDSPAYSYVFFLFECCFFPLIPFAFDRSSDSPLAAYLIRSGVHLFWPTWPYSLFFSLVTLPIFSHALFMRYFHAPFARYFFSSLAS